VPEPETIPPFELLALGPLHVRAAGADVAIRRAGERRLLALLLARCNDAVSTGVLLEELWPDRPAAEARPTLHVQMSRLRRTLGDRLVTRAQSYAIRPRAGEFDVATVEILLADAASSRSGRRPHEARDLRLQIVTGAFGGEDRLQHIGGQPDP